MSEWIKKNVGWRFGNRKNVENKAVENYKSETRKQHTRVSPETRARTEIFPRSENRKAVLPTWYFMTQFGQPRGIDVDELRTLAKTPTPWMCVRRLMDDVMSTQWEIVALPPKGKEKPTTTAVDHANIIRNFFYNPNQNHESWMTISGQMVADILELDSGVLFKEYAKGSSHYMVQLWARDGARYLKETDKYGALGKIQDVAINQKAYKNYNVAYWQHSYASDYVVPHEAHEVAYILQRPDTRAGRHGLYGTPPMEIVSLIVRTLMKGEEWYEEYYNQGATGSLAIMTPTTFDTDEDFQKWRKQIELGITARYIKRLYADNDAKFTSLGISPKEVEWLETKDEYRHLVMSNFNVTPEVLGFTKDIHKATMESQRDIYISRGLKPLLDLIEYHVNMEIITEFFWKEPEEGGVFTHGHKGKFAGKPIDVAFRYKLYDPIGYKRQLDIDVEELKSGMTTINRILERKGLQKLPWGDINPLFLMNPQQWSQSRFYNAFGDEQLREMTGIPKAPSTLPPPPSAELERGKAWLAFKQSRLPKVQRRKEYEIDTTYKLKRDIELTLRREFTKQEDVELPTKAIINQIINLLLAKLSTGKYFEEVLDEWIREDLVKKFLFSELGDDAMTRIQTALRRMFGQKPPEEYTR